MNGSDIDAYREMRWVWECHDDEEYRRNLSRWRGHGRWTTEEWGRLGNSVLRRVAALHQAVSRPLPDEQSLNVLEWGSGGGAGLVALAPYAATLYGVDVSTKNLAECQRQLAEVGVSGFVPILVEGAPSSAAAEVRSPIDVFVSTSAFHTFPRKRYGLDVLRTAYAVMAPGAVGCVQIRFDDGNPKYRPRSLDQYRTAPLFATSWGLSEFWRELLAAGFKSVQIAEMDLASNFATYHFQK